LERDDRTSVSVSRRIDAPAADIFKVLADPARHPEFDGSGMLRPGASNAAISGVGDVFVMKMFFPARGDYEMQNRVAVYQADRCIGWEPSLRNVDAAEADQSGNGSRWTFELTADGPGATVVTETYDCSASPEYVRQAVDNGKAWLAGMAKTLERLDDLCTKP
jgi:uncharacterized protein YndB with AHSA1/START domain